MKRSPMAPRKAYMTVKLKPVKCCICRQLFERFKNRATQTACGPECAAAAGRLATEKQQRAEAKRNSAALRTFVEENKSVPKLIAEVQTIFNRCIRLRDEIAGHPCICCGRMPTAGYSRGGDWDAGHYRSRGSAGHLRFVPTNVHRQLKQCNRGSAKSGHYRNGLVQRVGIDEVERLDADNGVVKWEKGDLRQRKKKYAAWEKELKAELKAQKEKPDQLATGAGPHQLFKVVNG